MPHAWRSAGVYSRKAGNKVGKPVQGFAAAYQSHQTRVLLAQLSQKKSHFYVDNPALL